jgi:aryl-alcohol dehydrogenase-like predicted oxidoreductase/enamine deaminase RidA (YjgF/YER057c/UK114 family)
VETGLGPLLDHPAPGAIERRRLAPDLEIARVLTGLWQIADVERRGALDLPAAAHAMREYIDAGFTTFDMADHYGSAEDIAGLCLAQSRQSTEIQIFTKWVPQPGPVTRARIRAAVGRSLERLRREMVDVLQFHAWNYADPSWLDALHYLQEECTEGRIHHLAVTNFDTAHLRIAVASGIRLLSNQVCYSLLDQRARLRMAPFCRDHGIALFAYGTIAGGLLTERWLGSTRPPEESAATWSQLKYARFVEAAGGWAALQRVLAALQTVARRRGLSMANVAARYILDAPGVTGIIIGARLTERAHTADTLQLSRGSLDADDRTTIEAALGTLTSIPGDTGDEYRRPPFLTASGDLSHHVERFPLAYAVQASPDGRERVLTGTSWESLGGFCRALRRGNRVWISGTTATHRDRVIGGADAAAQLHFIIDKIDGALQSLGGRLADVVRTRVYVRRLTDWESVARVHGERFGEIRPVNTLVQAGLVGDDYLVEMEADAEIAGG